MLTLAVFMSSGMKGLSALDFQCPVAGFAEVASFGTVKSNRGAKLCVGHPVAIWIIQASDRTFISTEISKV